MLPPAGANYVIVKLAPDGAKLLYAGETDSLAACEWEDILGAARKQHQGAEVLTRLNVSSATRRAERADLVERHSPPFNAD